MNWNMVKVLTKGVMVGRNGMSTMKVIQADILEDEATLGGINSRGTVTHGGMTLPTADLMKFCEEVLRTQYWVCVFAHPYKDKTWVIIAESEDKAWHKLELRMTEDGYTEDEQQEANLLASTKFHTGIVLEVNF